ncbi:MAG TPA: isochorismatase family cysteine hydrolase, partial [Solirubrobacterales bacterium]|nr:isochorismatase family cysteine hydrolase [Solirubrobacterales bacterium]
GGTDDIKSQLVEGGTNWRHLEKIYMNLDQENMDELGWEGTKWVDLMVEEDPRDLYVRTKKRLSGFYPTDLEFLLRQLGVRNLVIDGTLTDCCVLNTAFDAANRDFRVVVPRDVAAGMSQEMEGAAEKVIANHLGLIVDAPALLREWYARQGAELPADLARAETMDDVTFAKT